MRFGSFTNPSRINAELQTKPLLDSSLQATQSFGREIRGKTAT